MSKYKKWVIFFAAFLVIFAGQVSAESDRVYVKGYYRKDGTYVRPHYRSSPDSTKSNNYGKASNSQRQEWSGLSELPSYKNDYDGDGITNKNDSDDDNDGIGDDYDSNQWGK